MTLWCWCRFVSFRLWLLKIWARPQWGLWEVIWRMRVWVLYGMYFLCALVCTTTGAQEALNCCSNEKICAKKNMYTIPKNFIWPDFVKMKHKFCHRQTDSVLVSQSSLICGGVLCLSLWAMFGRKSPSHSQILILWIMYILFWYGFSLNQASLMRGCQREREQIV